MSLFVTKAYAESCPSGMTFNSTLNRCLTNQQTTRVINATQNCKGNKECYMRNAKNELTSSGAEGFKDPSGYLAATTKGLATAIPIAMARQLSKLKGNTCSQVSYGLFIAAGLAMWLGDMFINIAHKKRLDKIKSEWGNIVNPTQANGNKDLEREASINAQAEAFQKLADAERSLATAAGSKSTLYYIATAGFAAAAITAGLELFDPKGWTPCKDGPVDSKETPDQTDNEVNNTETPDKVDENNIDIYEDKTGSTDSILVYKPTDSIFQYVSSESYRNSFKIRIHNKTFYRNIINSGNFSELIANQYALEKKDSSPTLDEYEQIHSSLADFSSIDSDVFKLFKSISLTVLTEMSPIKIAHSKDDDKTNAAMAFEKEGKAFDKMNMWAAIGGGVIGIAAALISKPLSAWMVSSWGRVILGSVLGGLTLATAIHAGNVSKTLKGRASKLEDMKRQFISSAESLYACKSEDRDDPNKPECYCYTPDNQKNPNRNNSKTCLNLWSGKNTNSTNYLAKDLNKKICINNSRSPDPMCACRKTNTCLKMSASGLNGVNVGTFSMINGGFSDLNKFSNGQAGLGDLAKGNPSAKALRMMGALKKFVDSKPMQKYKKKIKQGELKVAKKLNQINQKIPQTDMIGKSASPLPSNPKEAIAELKKEFAPRFPVGANGNSGEISSQSKSSGDDFNLDLGLDDSDNIDAQVAEVMKQDFEYGNNDINEGKSNNIFNILSNRYQRSGMRRLFDEEGVTQPEAPASNEISDE